ncbi:DUF3040 domain-containing protein [Nocardiopsis sp. MG754419]|uniref:DUF3040 domain-containing protein n=1 Tax=Nocardiopsis sp. MG754419 TaxID=2259865 RepID=UPI001BAB9DDC|nr:DUF3040 domain-containing protein [Nocardiopsis sp. MG754419]MBR8740857.1 hypothetical protein [Nocardiopsis sp. MG754419]
MSLREHERRILAQIEKQLSEDAPELAGRLEAFGTEDPDAPVDPGLQSWRPWVACALIAAVTAALLVLLFVVTPNAPQPEQPRPAGTSESSQGVDTGDPGPAPEGEPVNDPPAPAGPAG